MHSDFIDVQATRKPLFYHSLHFLWCMTQRSLHAVIKVYFRSMSCFAMIFHKGPACGAKVSHKCPSCTMWAWAKYHANSYWSEQDTLPIVFLISKQVIPYRTRGGTFCPGVSTPKIRSLIDSSNHIPWRSKPSPPFQIFAQTTASNLTTVNSHHDGFKTTTLALRHKSYSISQRMEDL
jgi:hypothetical protein